MQSWLKWLDTHRCTNWRWNPFRHVWDETPPSHIWGVGGFKGLIKRKDCDSCFISLHAFFGPMYLLLETDLLTFPLRLTYLPPLPFNNSAHLFSLTFTSSFDVLSVCFFLWLTWSSLHYWFGTWKECALNVLWRNVELQLHHSQGRPNVSTFMCLWF